MIFDARALVIDMRTVHLEQQNILTSTIVIVVRVKIVIVASTIVHSSLPAYMYITNARAS